MYKNPRKLVKVRIWWCGSQPGTRRRKSLTQREGSKSHSVNELAAMVARHQIGPNLLLSPFLPHVTMATVRYIWYGTNYSFSESWWHDKQFETFLQWNRSIFWFFDPVEISIFKFFKTFLDISQNVTS